MSVSIIHMFFPHHDKPVAPPPRSCFHPAINRNLRPPFSRNHTLHPPLLQPPHLVFERLHLLPAVQRTPVILQQTPHHLAPRHLYTLRHLFDQLARLQLPLELLNLLGGLVPARRGGFGGRLLGNLGEERGETARLFVVQLAKLVADAGLDL